MIFVDTSVWYARFVPDDPDHARMVNWFASNNERLLTSDYCVDETLTLVSVRKRPLLATEVGHQFFQESIAQLHFLTRGQVERAWILFQHRSAAGWSFTDCTCKIVVDDFELKKVASLDLHFAQFGVSLVP